jgi:cell division protein FtsL
MNNYTANTSTNTTCMPQIVHSDESFYVIIILLLIIVILSLISVVSLTYKYKRLMHINHFQPIDMENSVV